MAAADVEGVGTIPAIAPAPAAMPALDLVIIKESFFFLDFALFVWLTDHAGLPDNELAAI